MHYLDFDRALHWAAVGRAELAAVLRVAAEHQALLVGRTAAAHRSHHRALVATEQPANAAFASRLGFRSRVDFLVPSFVLTRPLTATLVRRSRARDADVYGEWPALLALLGVPLAYVECDGLEWETPDRAHDEVRRIGLGAWRRRFDSPEEWRARRAMAARFRRGFASTLGRRRPRPTLARATIRRPK